MEKVTEQHMPEPAVAQFEKKKKTTQEFLDT
jgi:hypothetical protein